MKTLSAAQVDPRATTQPPAPEVHNDHQLAAEVARLREVVRNYERQETRLRERLAQLEGRKAPFCPHALDVACPLCQHEATQVRLEDALARTRELEQVLLDRGGRDTGERRRSDR